MLPPSRCGTLCELAALRCVVFLSRLADAYPLGDALLARARFYAGALALREALARLEWGYTSGAFRSMYFPKNNE